jgi:hypothetical protein
MKTISIIAPYRKGDVWSVPLSYYYEFKRLGYNVKIFNNLNEDQPGITQMDPRAWNEEGLQQLLKEANDGIFVPNLIFHFDFGLYKSPFLNKKHFPKALWIYESGDDPQCFSYNFEKVKSGNFDLIMSPDIRAVNEYNKRGFKAVWSPHFADPLFLGEEIEPAYDAITSRHFSEPFFKELKGRLGERFFARDQFINEKDHLQFLKQGKIIVQNSKYKEITRRIFEGMLANRLVITDRPDPATKIDLIFKENVDIVYFDNIDDCVKKIKYFSSNQKELERISKTGYNKVLKNHTIQKRIQHLIKIL